MSREIHVRVYRTFGIYHAHAGKGMKAKRVVSKMSGPAAVLDAAAQFLEVPQDRVTLSKAAPGVFLATVIEPQQGGAS